MKWSKIAHLYIKFRAQNVVADILWDLDDEMLEHCKLNPMEKLAFNKAKESHVSANKGK